MTPDPTYFADAIVWLLVWASLGLAARQVIASGDARRRAARARRETERAAR